ncbi:MAG: hypothetical protein V1819_00915 [bacterium]
MNKNTTLIIIGVILCLIISGLFIFRSHSNSNLFVIDCASRESNDSWKTFDHPTHNFQIKYPQNWVLDYQEDGGDVKMLIPTTRNFYAFVIMTLHPSNRYIAPGSGESIDEVISSGQVSRFFEEKLKAKEYDMCGQKVYVAQKVLPFSGKKFFYQNVYFVDYQRRSVFEIWLGLDQQLDKKELLDLFHQMLLSLKFK